MAKGRLNRHQGKRSSTVVLVLSMLLMLTVVLLMLLALGIFNLPVDSHDESSSSINDHVKFKRLNLNVGEGDGLGERGEQWTEILSWEPRAFLFHNFLVVTIYRLSLACLVMWEKKSDGNARPYTRLAPCGSIARKHLIGKWRYAHADFVDPVVCISKEECEYLINQAKPHMVKSTVIDRKTGQSIDSRVRTSSGMFLRRGGDKIIRNIEKRIADFTFIPVEHGESLQVLHYEVGQKYEPHFDYVLDEFHSKNWPQRIATVLMYLSDVEEGGETIFPAAKGNFSSNPAWNELSECAKKGLSVKPKMGNALLFWSMRPDATLDPSSLHGGCPVIKGNKWSSTKWMHVAEFQNKFSFKSLKLSYRQ